jgi:hypothetical protein
MEKERNNHEEALSVFFDHLVVAGRKALKARNENADNYGLLLTSAVSLGIYFRSKPVKEQERVVKEKLGRMSQVDVQGKLADAQGIDAIRLTLSSADQELRLKKLSEEQGREVENISLNTQDLFEVFN